MWLFVGKFVCFALLASANCQKLIENFFLFLDHLCVCFLWYHSCNGYWSLGIVRRPECCDTWLLGSMLGCFQQRHMDMNFHLLEIRLHMTRFHLLEIQYHMVKFHLLEIQLRVTFNLFIWRNFVSLPVGNLTRDSDQIYNFMIWLKMINLRLNQK